MFTATTFEGLITISLRARSSVRFNSLNPNVISSALGGSRDVCDNLLADRSQVVDSKAERCSSGQSARLEIDSARPC